MKVRKLIALLLCVVTVIGILPMAITAEETATVANTTEKVKFDLMLDFNAMETTTEVNANSFTDAAKDETHFTLTHYTGTSSLSYVDKGDGDIALRTTGKQGLMIKDPQTLLARNSFVLEYDVRFETVAEGFNTVQFSFKNNAGTQVKTGLVPINANKLTGADGNKYGATYHMTNNQNIGATVRPSGVAQDLIVYPDQWYHYALYVDSVNNKIVAYRDGSRIWSSTLTSFPDDMTDFQIWIHSGGSSSVTHYDNIHLQSLNSMEIDQSISFEGVTFAEGVTSVNATSAMLEAELDMGNSLSFPYVHATNAKVETDGLNNYLVGSSTGNTLGSGQKSSYFQLGDNAARLTTESWTFAFDFCAPGISNGTTEYEISSYDVSLFGLVVDGTYNNILIAQKSKQLQIMPAKTNTNFYIKSGAWYRFFASYNADTQKLSLHVLGADEGFVDLGTYDYAVSKTATETFFRFGFNWQAGQYSKFYFDNMVLTTEDDVNIDVNFENGTAGERLIPSDISLGGAYASGAVNNGKFSKSTWSDSLRYYDDGTGNTYLGSSFGTGSNYLWIRDQTLKTLTQKFVVSCDFKINQTATAYTAFSWRLGNEKSENVPLFIVMSDQTLNIRPKLTGSSYAYKSSALEDGKWYNIAAIIDPVGKTAEFYIGGLDTEPVYTTTFDYDFSVAKVSAFSFGPGAGKITVDGAEVTDHLGYDNIRIYTLDETIEEATPPSDINMSTLGADGVILETDFEGFEASTAMISEAWNQVAPFGVTATDGTVVEANGNKHFQPMTGSGATSFNISSFNASPYLEGVIALESDFTLGDNSANSGNLVIAALKRVGIDGTTINAPLLTADKNGKLTVAQHATDYTLPSETIRIRLEVCYAFHTVNLYVNGEAIATAIPLKVNTNLAIPEKYLIDSFGNKHELPFTGYTYDYGFYNDGMQIRYANGGKAMFPHYYENYGYSQTLSYIKDSIDMFSASSDESWSFAMDNLKIYLDKDADIYFNGFDSWASGVVGTSEYQTTVESPFAAKGAKFIDDGGNTVFSTVSEDSTVYNGSFFFTDKNKFLDGKTFVFEFDIKYNPDFENVNLGDSATNGLAILTDLDWHHTFRIYEDGRYGVPSAGVVDGYLKANDWSKVQVLFTPNASGNDHTVRVYVDGILSSKSASLSFLHTLRLGCEANSYDAKFDNIRIYLSDKPEAFESVIKGSLDGKSLLSLEVSDTASLEKAMANKTAGLVWNFKNFDFSSNDINESTVNVLLNKGDYVRVVHNYIKDTSPYNIFVNKAALEGHKQYVFETEIRYTCPTGFELEVISTFDAATQSKDRLVYVLGTSREIVFNRNGFTYNLTDSLGNKLYAEAVTDNATEFTKIAVIVDEAAGNYSVYVNDNVAYYNYGGEIVTATAIDIDKTPIYEPSGLITSMASTLSLLNMPTSTSADALLDIKSANFYVLRTGVAPRVVSSQSKIEATKFDVRFIAPIDMLYGSEVGFDITTDQTGAKEVTRSTNFVFSSIKALDPESGNEIDVTAEEFNGTYLAVISVTGANVVDTVKFTVKPFIKIGDSKIYNESFTVTYSDGKAVTE